MTKYYPDGHPGPFPSKLLAIAEERLRKAEEHLHRRLLERVEKEGWNPTVYIRRQWNDWRIASVHFDQIDDLHWDDMSGGVFARAPQPFIHGYVWCTDVEGEIAHSCLHGEGPHRIKVCVVKKDNERQTFDLLLAIVGPKPKWKKADEAETMPPSAPNPPGPDDVPGTVPTESEAAVLRVKKSLRGHVMGHIRRRLEILAEHDKDEVRAMAQELTDRIWALVAELTKGG